MALSLTERLKLYSKRKYVRRICFLIQMQAVPEFNDLTEADRDKMLKTIENMQMRDR